MVVNPCCMPLQRGVVIMAVIDIVLDIINIISAVLALVAVTVYKNDLQEDEDITDKEIKVATAVVILLLILYILGLLMSMRLYFGAKRRDIRNCRIWIIVSCILFILNVISSIINAASGDFATLSLVTTIIAYVYRIYMIWVVFCFIKELQEEQQQGLAFEARLEHGVGYSMQSFPNNSGNNYPPPPPYTVNLNNYPGQAANGNNQGAGLYNPNSQFRSTNNI